MWRTGKQMVLAVLMLGALTVYAGPGTSVPANDSARFRAMDQRMARDLGLTKDQQEKIKKLHGDMKNARKDHGNQMKAIMDKSKTELLKNSPSKVVLYGLAKEMGDLRAEMAKFEVDHLLLLKAVLTPEQFHKLLSKPAPCGPGQMPPPECGDSPCNKPTGHR